MRRFVHRGKNQASDLSGVEHSADLRNGHVDVALLKAEFKDMLRKRFQLCEALGLHRRQAASDNQNRLTHIVNIAFHQIFHIRLFLYARILQRSRRASGISAAKASAGKVSKKSRSKADFAPAWSR